MSKRYKLIKEYPLSPELGFITDETMYFPCDYPEFWEEIKDKEWKITKFKGSKDLFNKYIRVVVDENETGFKLNHYPAFDSKSYVFSTMEIYEVKRISDNITFSVGDKIKCLNSHIDIPEAITKIELNKEGTPCLFTNSFRNNGVNIFKAVKVKKLFTTKDGVDIFNGDIYWFVIESDSKILQTWNPRSHVCDWSNSEEYQKMPLGHVQFSTKEAAQKYIDSKKVYFTTKDGCPITIGDSYFMVMKNNFDLSQWIMNESFVSSDLKGESDTCIRFKHEEAAKNWIEVNKLVYSKKDIIDACSPYKYSSVVGCVLDKLKLN